MLRELLLVKDLLGEGKTQAELAKEKLDKIRYVRDIIGEGKKNLDLINKVRRIRASIKVENK